MKGTEEVSASLEGHILMSYVSRSWVLELAGKRVREQQGRARRTKDTLKSDTEASSVSA